MDAAEFMHRIKPLPHYTGQRVSFVTYVAEWRHTPTGQHGFCCDTSYGHRSKETTRACLARHSAQIMAQVAEAELALDKI